MTETSEQPLRILHAVRAPVGGIIHRDPHPADLLVWARFKYLIWRLKPDILHGHGAKAGVFIRLKSRSEHSIRVYTPHGGSLHYPPNTWKGSIYGGIERTLMDHTDLFLF